MSIFDDVLVIRNGEVANPRRQGYFELVDADGVHRGSMISHYVGNGEYEIHVCYESHFDSGYAEHLGWSRYRTEYLERELLDAVAEHDLDAAREINDELERRRTEQS